jgi:hypothetical protein
MIPNEESTDAFTAVLDEAGARRCVSCGRRAAVPTVLGVVVPAAAAPDSSALADSAKWFCFQCGYEE